MSINLKRFERFSSKHEPRKCPQTNSVKLYKCFNLKYNCCNLFVSTSKTTEPVKAGSKHLKILYSTGKSTGHWVCTYYNGNAIIIYDCLNSHNLNEDLSYI